MSTNVDLALLESAISGSGAEAMGSVGIAGNKLDMETAVTEFEFATLLAGTLPPIKTVGDVWYVFRSGVWQPMCADTLKPAALDILPENLRTIRRAKALLDHIAAAQQTDGSKFKGFHAFDPDGAVLVNACNGVVRVTESTFELLPHSAKHHFTRQTAACFNPRATAPLFERVLSEALPGAEDRELFQLCSGWHASSDGRMNPIWPESFGTRWFRRTATEKKPDSASPPA